MSTYVYIDGFNLYYGAIKGTPYKWLDIKAMCHLLLPGEQINAVKYYTAIVSARPGDPDKPTRHNIYIRALRSLPSVTVSLGQYLSHQTMMRLANPPLHGPKFVRVIKTEEKGTDVNLATHILHDAHLNRYNTAVLISNDSDLLEPIRIVRQELKKKVGIINPRHQRPSRVLAAEADFFKQIRPGLLAKCLLPPTLTDAQGEIRKPATW